MFLERYMCLDPCATQKSWHKSQSSLIRKFYTDGLLVYYAIMAAVGEQHVKVIAWVVETESPKQR